MTPIKTVLLEHRASFVQPLPGRSLFAAASDFKHVSVFDLVGDQAQIAARLLPREFGQIHGLAAHPSEPRLALIENDTLVVVDLEGTRFFSVSAPRKSGRFGAERGLLAVVFDPWEPFLWSVVRHSPDAVEIQVHDRDRGTLIQSCHQEDPYGESYCSLYVNTPGAGVTLWLAGGQDGQQIYWLRQEREGIVCVPEPVLEDTAPPVFSPSGDEFLVWSDYALHRYAYPSRERLGTFSCPWEYTEWSYDFCYVDATRALVASSKQRLFMLDLEKGTLTHEVFVQGQEQKPTLTSAFDPERNLDTENQADVAGFKRFGEWLLLYANADRTAGASCSGDRRKEALRFLPMDADNRFLFALPQTPGRAG